MTQLQSASVIFKQTGASHNAAISDGNTFLNIDKILDVIMHLISYMVIVYKRHISVRDKVLIFSGRISSEILIKAAKIGVV